MHGKGVYFQLGKPADMSGSAAVAIPRKSRWRAEGTAPAVDEGGTRLLACTKVITFHCPARRCW